MARNKDPADNLTYLSSQLQFLMDAKLFIGYLILHGFNCNPKYISKNWDVATKTHISAASHPRI